MSQGLYRCLGFGCLNPPQFELFACDIRSPMIDVLRTSYEAKPDYAIIPMAVDNEFLQKEWGLPPLPDGLPHVKDRSAVAVPRCDWWPDVSQTGVWVPYRIAAMYELARVVARQLGWELPEGEPVFVCDWDLSVRRT